MSTFIALPLQIITATQADLLEIEKKLVSCTAKHTITRRRFSSAETRRGSS